MLLIKLNGTTRAVNAEERRGHGQPEFWGPYAIRKTLQTKGEITIIRLNDGRRMVIAASSRKLPINELATEMLRKLSEQKNATVHGIAIIATLFEIGNRYRSEYE